MHKITRQKASKTQNDTLARVRSAEELRSSRRCKQSELIKTTGLSESTYSRSVWLLKYGDPDLIEAVNQGLIGVATACDQMHTRLGNKYRHQETLSGAEILCQAPQLALYRKDGELQLATVVNGKGTEHVYLITDNPSIVEQIKQIMRLVDLAGYRLYSTGHIKKPDGTPYGHLAHHASLVPVNPQYRCKVKRTNGKYDLRQGRVRFYGSPHAYSPPVLVYKYQDTIELLSRNSETITQIDFDCDMLRFLESANLHDSTRDHRLRVKIDNEHDPYLYMLIMACHLYGEAPRDNAHTAGLVDRFCADYSGMQIDHLNADPQDCRIANLMIMSGTQNRKKQALQKKLRKIGGNFYVDLSRSDNEHVYMEAGETDKNGAKNARISGIFNVPEMLEQYADFINLIQEDRQDS